MKELDPNKVESSELVDQTFDFWFNGRDHIRSPFPKYIHSELKSISTQKFYKWAAGLDVNAKDEVNETIIGEKFEEIIFEAAMDLVMTDDEKITINYPFLPRIGDEIDAQKEDNVDERSLIIKRSLNKNGDNLFLKVILERINSKEKWETEFELPA